MAPTLHLWVKLLFLASSQAFPVGTCWEWLHGCPGQAGDRGTCHGTALALLPEMQSQQGRERFFTDRAVSPPFPGRSRATRRGWTCWGCRIRGTDAWNVAELGIAKGFPSSSLSSTTQRIDCPFTGQVGRLRNEEGV